ncbi:hypothetical protein PJM46_29875, partial [Mycobacterium kansasii]
MPQRHYRAVAGGSRRAVMLDCHLIEEPLHHRQATPPADIGNSGRAPLPVVADAHFGHAAGL